MKIRPHTKEGTRHVRFDNHRFRAQFTVQRVEAEPSPTATAETGCRFVIGILWLLIGFIALFSYRPSSISVAVIFIVVAFWMGALSAFIVASVVKGGWRFLAITVGILATLAAVGALVWPAPTLLIVSIFVAWYLLLSGIFEVVIALSNTDVRGWWIRLLGGLCRSASARGRSATPTGRCCSSSPSSAFANPPRHGGSHRRVPAP